jgi:hypothetical protein
MHDIRLKYQVISTPRSQRLARTRSCDSTIMEDDNPLLFLPENLNYMRAYSQAESHSIIFEQYYNASRKSY